LRVAALLTSWISNIVSESIIVRADWQTSVDAKDMQINAAKNVFVLFIVISLSSGQFHPIVKEEN